MSLDEILRSGVGSKQLAMHAAAMRSPENLGDLTRRFCSALESFLEVPAFAQQTDWRPEELKVFSGMMIWYAAGQSLFGQKWLEGLDVRESYLVYADFDEMFPLMIGGLPNFVVGKGHRAREYLVSKCIWPAIAGDSTQVPPPQCHMCVERRHTFLHPRR